MIMHGKVEVWYMSEEQRLAYIAKHPIRSEEKPKGSSFSNIHEYGERKKTSKETIMDKVDKVELHKRFLAGERLEDISKSLQITTSTLNNFIKEQRKIEPYRWPHRSKKDVLKNGRQQITNSN